MPFRDMLLLPHFWSIVISSVLSIAALLTVFLKKDTKISFIFHTVLMSLSIVLNFMAIILTRNFNLRSLHAILGMNSANLFITAAFGGILAKLKIRRKETVKKIHLWWGVIVFLYSIGVSIYGIISFI